MYLVPLSSYIERDRDSDIENIVFSVLKVFGHHLAVAMNSREML